MNISITPTTAPKAKPTDESKLGFGQYFTDHMFLMNYDEGEGWHSPRVVPYGPLELDPAAMVLHYGQEVFEGLKAYRGKDDKILLFRPDENFKRLNRSNERLCIPAFDEEVALQGLVELVKVDQDWIPHATGTSLYIRPFIFATDARLGVHPGKHYLFVIILSPVGSYYKEGLNPVKIYVETKWVRAVRGGIGAAKTGGNYAASLKAQDEAEDQSYSQVLWLDGVERKYVEEVGTMNVFFVIDGEIVTPALQGSILPGITRKSSIELLRQWGYKVTERQISIAEIYEAYKAGKLSEAFGTGTAAVISPIGTLKWDDVIMEINEGAIGPVAQKLYDTITGIQSGALEGPSGWAYEVH